MEKAKYVPYTGPQCSENDSYRYLTMEHVLATASSQYKFNQDIDNSEEEELTDDELREKIKNRKANERARRDSLTVTKTAALDVTNNVELLRKKIPGGSVVDKCINLDALKLRQAKLR